MAVKYTREHHGYPGYPEATVALTVANGAKTMTEALAAGSYREDDNGMKNIGAMITPIVDGIWYTFGGVDPIVDTVGHRLAANETLILQSRYEVDNIIMISDDGSDNAVVTVTFLFPRPPTLTVP